MKTPLRFLAPALPLALAAAALAQVPDSPPPQQQPQPQAQPPPPASSSDGDAAPQQGSFLGSTVPIFDPGEEIFTWDGHTWHATDNRLFQARFEKYLNAPEETTAQDKAYQQLIATILADLAPGDMTSMSIDAAFRLLPRTGVFPIDAHLCDAIADAVYSVWRAQAAADRLAQATEALEQERKAQEWNTWVATNTMQRGEAPYAKNAAAQAQYSRDEEARRDAELQPHATRLGEILANIKADQAKKELTELQAKIEFQALLVQLFLQRRFQHVLIGTRFYRAIFTDGDTKLQLGKDAHDLFANSTGLPPTVATLDSMADEVIRDVGEGVQSFEYLLGQHELESASKRLAEAFTAGEYLPAIRTLPRSEKRQALAFCQKSDQLISALDVRDYALAEKLVGELSQTATDFDTSKATAAIETARQISALHLAKARNAAVSGDRITLDQELQAATKIWPRNPDLAKVSGLIFSQSDLQQKALTDLDGLIAQHNYRAVYDDRMRFIAAVALYPDRQEQLRKVLDQMQVIETVMAQAQEAAKHGDAPGAWEAVEKVFRQYPDDSKLNALRADLTTEAVDFVRAIRTAQDLESKDQLGSSLAWALKAQKIYPPSEFAQDAIRRLTKKILPDSATSS